MPRDDDRLAAASRALRRRQRQTHDDLVGPGRSRWVPRLIEDGRAGELRLNELRAHFAKLGATVRVTAWYEGATLDRLIDLRHASVVEAGVLALARRAWATFTEISFNEWGERGSIDFMGVREEERAIVIGEAKSEWGSIEETLRTLDVKVRLAPVVAEKRLGWRPRLVGVVLAFPEDATARRLARRHQQTLASALPDRGSTIRKWLRRPHGPLRGLWFLSNVHGDVRRGD